MKRFQRISEWHTVGTKLIFSVLKSWTSSAFLSFFFLLSTTKDFLTFPWKEKNKHMFFSFLCLVWTKCCALFVFGNIVLFLAQWPKLLQLVIKRSGVTHAVKFVWLIPLCWWQLLQWCQWLAHVLFWTARVFITIIITTIFNCISFFKKAIRPFVLGISDGRKRLQNSHCHLVVHSDACK